jgi:hypothetical protein
MSDSQKLAAAKAMVEAGAEIEQRDIEGEPVAFDENGDAANVFALARDTFDVTRDNDGVTDVWLRPLYGLEGRTTDGRAVFDSNMHQPRPVHAVRLDVLGNGNIGLAHNTGTYSVIRPVSSERRARLVDDWDTAEIV